MILSIKDLSISYHNENQIVEAVKDINIEIKKGDFVGIVGESGSGKSSIADSILTLLPSQAEQKGSITFNGINLDKKSFESLRGKNIAYISQNFYKSLSDFFTIKSHFKLFFKSKNKRNSNSKDLSNFIELLSDLSLENPQGIMKQYPFELSGGMIQRVCIAFSIMNYPEFLIADEPTSAVDAIAKKEFIHTLKKYSLQNSMTILMISHDLNLIFEFCSQIIVIYRGKIIEKGDAKSVFEKKLHPYTRLLIDSAKVKTHKKEQTFSLSSKSECVYNQKCMIKNKTCTPEKIKISDNHFVYCSEIKYAQN